MASNSISQVEIIERSILPTQAEVWVRVAISNRSANSEIRGRFVGPRCPGVSTVEVAYPLRPPPFAQKGAELSITRRVVIPEPSLWEDETPFVYEAVVELWENGERVDERRLTVPLRNAARKR